MAEAPVEKMDKVLASEHLNCPICLEVYRTPRSLPCLHTFCTECIASVIERNATQWSDKMEIECPICRRTSPSPAPNKSATEWVQELPLNYAIMSLLETLGQAESETRACGPCAANGEDHSAVSFCLDCSVYQCDRCTKRHDKYPLSRNHKTIKAGEAPENTVSVLDFGKMAYCETHSNKEIEFYCEEHDVLCCSTCAIVGHRSCARVEEVKELGKALKKGRKPKKLMEQMRRLKKGLGDNSEVIDASLTEIDNQTGSAKQTIEGARVCMIHQVNQTMDQLVMDCDVLKKELSIKLQDQSFQQKSQLAAITGSYTLLSSSVKQGTDSQAFIAYHKVKQQVRQCDLNVQQDNAAGADHLQLVLDLDKGLITWNETTKGVGKVSIESKGKGLPNKPVTGTAALETAPVGLHKLEKLPLADVPKRQNRKQPLYRGGVYIDDELVVADYNNFTCCSLDGQFNVSAEVKLPGRPADVSSVGESQVVVTLPSTSTIQCVTVDNKSLTLGREIPCSRPAMRVCAVSKTELAVGWQTGFGTIRLDGQETSFIDRDAAGRQIKFQTHDFMAVDSGRARVYQTCEKEDAVYAFGFTGEPHFTYKHENLKEPAGIALDRELNVFICSYVSDTIHKVSPKGVALLAIDTGMNRPYMIAFRSILDHMIVFNNVAGAHKALPLRIIQEP